MNTYLKIKRREISKKRSIDIKKSICDKKKRTVGFYVHKEPAEALVFVDNRPNTEQEYEKSFKPDESWFNRTYYSESPPTYDSEDQGMVKDYAGCGRDCDWCGNCMY